MKILLTISGVFVVLALALAVHIYWVTRSHADVHTRAMARIDLHQKIGKEDADRITAWLYRQKGVDHVLVNPRSSIAVFLFSPVAADANRIVSAFRDSLPYPKARRYLPSAGEIKRGCPMTATPFTNRIYNFIKQLF